MALRYRASAALAKGATMGLFGLWVIGIIGGMPCTARCRRLSPWAVSALPRLSPTRFLCLLWRHRTGDANMRSAWICTRNDVLGNLAVLLAALGVFGTGTGWPDIVVAAIMAVLALQGSVTVVRHALAEFKQPAAATA